MISIRLRAPLFPSSFPIAIRFVQDLEDVSPAWPILPPTLGSANTFQHRSWLSLQPTRVRSSHSTHRLSIGFASNIHKASTAVHLPIAPCVLQQRCRFNNADAALSILGSFTRWRSALQASNLTSGWHFSIAMCTQQHFVSQHRSVLQSTRTRYQAIDVMATRYSSMWQQQFQWAAPYLPYGPRPAQWRCDVLRIATPGHARLRLKETPSSLRMVFEPLAKVCRWDEGGGYKQAHPVLPALDFVIPIEPTWQRSYVMQPSILCERLSDGQSIAITQISISKRRGNFAKACAVTFQSKIDMERARNQPLKVVINGYEHRVIIEQCSSLRSFGDASYQGQGRSLAALLASPYQLATTYANASDRSLLGIVSDLLDGTGWSAVAEGFADFTIPAGAFSIQGKAPLEAIATQLDGIGLMLHANDATKQLKLIPKWPVAPWRIATQSPAIVFHQGVMQSLSDSEEISRLCNGIYVRGEQVGISAHVKRQGTAGDVTPNDINHPLIVTPIAAQLCGTAALSDTGNKRRWQLTAPVMPTLPIVTEGQLIGIRDDLDQLHLAMVDSWSVTATMSSDGAVSVKQSISALEPLEV